MATKIPQCSFCGSAGHYAYQCFKKPKPVPRAGKHTNKDRYENKKFRETRRNHEGYLICECCGSWNGSDADHVDSKGANPDKRYTGRKQILCRPCHDNKTNNRECDHKKLDKGKRKG